MSLIAFKDQPAELNERSGFPRWRTERAMGGEGFAEVGLRVFAASGRPGEDAQLERDRPPIAAGSLQKDTEAGGWTFVGS